MIFAPDSKFRVAPDFDEEEKAVLYHGDCLRFLKTLPEKSFQLVVTSPPYNLGKEYERVLDLRTYLRQQESVIAECVRVLRTSGHLCWQVGNYVTEGSIVPLDAALFPVFRNHGLKMRNRIVWHFEHGLHCSKRFPASCHGEC